MRLKGRVLDYILFEYFLDYDRSRKRSDDVLDVRLRQKYDLTNITFKSVGDLRRNFPSQENLSALQLIRSYQEKIKSQINKDQVNYYFVWVENYFDAELI